jgi:glycosyltransferase involved in cell wall biosynthesis
MNPDVSVIIPAYNRFTELVYAVESVLAQTLPVKEIIIIDDGSVGKIPEMIPRIIGEKPAWHERVHYFRQENQGQSIARNNGIARATGEWLAFNDSDDLWLPQKLEWQFRALEKDGRECGLCFTDAWFMNSPRMKMTLFQLADVSYESQIGVIENLVAFIEHLSQVWVQTVVVRTDIVQKLPFDKELHFQEDQDLFFRIALITKCCYVNIPMVLIDRSPAEERHGTRSLEWHKEAFRLKMLQYRYEKILSQNDGLPIDIRNLFRKNLRDVHSSWANHHLRAGDYEKALESVSKAAEYEVTPGIALKWVLTVMAPWVVKRALIRREQSKAWMTELDPMK